MNDQYHGAFDLVVNTLAEMDRKDLIPLFKEAIHRFDLGCIKLTDSLWKKLPVVLNDAKHFQGLNVVDVGSMQGFSSFFLYHIGGAKSVVAVEHKESYVNCCNNIIRPLCDNNVESVKSDIVHFFKTTKMTEQDGIYASDILYQIKNNDLKDIKQRLLENPPKIILSHSRENKRCRRKNNLKLSRHENLAAYIADCGFEIEYPNHETTPQPMSKMTKDLWLDCTDDLKEEFIKNAFDSWVTIVGSKTEF